MIPPVKSHFLVTQFHSLLVTGEAKSLSKHLALLTRKVEVWRLCSSFRVAMICGHMVESPTSARAQCCTGTDNPHHALRPQQLGGAGGGAGSVCVKGPLVLGLSRSAMQHCNMSQTGWSDCSVWCVQITAKTASLMSTLVTKQLYMLETLDHTHLVQQFADLFCGWQRVSCEGIMRMTEALT